MKRFVSTALWPQVEVNSANSMEIMVRKVGEAYERQVPIFARKVKFLELARVKGEGYKEQENKINQQSELEHLEGIRAKDLQLKKLCQGLHKSDRLYNKIIDMDIKSWASAQEIIKKYAENQALKTDLVKSAPKAQGQMLMKLSGGKQSPTRRPSSQSPGRERRKPDPGSQRQSRERARGGEGQKGGRSPSNSRECCGWN